MAKNKEKKDDFFDEKINEEVCFPALFDFLVYMNAVKGLSVSTIYGYQTDLMLLFKYLKKSREKLECDIEDVDIREIDAEFLQSVTLTEIYNFLSFVKIKRKNKAVTMARKATVFRMFFKFLYLKVKIIDEDPTAALDLPKKGVTLPKYLTEEQSLKLLNSVDGDNKERDYCILCILLNCGLRVSELVGINLADIQEEGTILIRGKGNKERLIYFNDACKEAVEEYQQAKPTIYNKRKYDTRALFLGRSGKRLTARRVEQLVQDRMVVAGFGSLGISPHKLRHSYATRIYKDGTDIRLLKDILGHASLSTTQIYTHTSSDAMRKAMTEQPLKKG